MSTKIVKMIISLKWIQP